MVESKERPQKKENSSATAFRYISETFSTTDIRSVYAFERLIGGGHFGSVRKAYPISDP